MEDPMCYSRDYKHFDEREQRKVANTQLMQERRTGVIGKLLDDANKQGEKAKEATPAKEVAPAK
jgi:hypothetical protein